MSVGKNRQTYRSYPPRQSYPSCQTHPIYQSYPSHRLPLNAAVISAVARADVRRPRRPSLVLGPCIGAAPGCRATAGYRGGAEAQGGWTR